MIYGMYMANIYKCVISSFGQTNKYQGKTASKQLQLQYILFWEEKEALIKCNRNPTQSTKHCVRHARSSVQRESRRSALSIWFTLIHTGAEVVDERTMYGNTKPAIGPNISKNSATEIYTRRVYYGQKQRDDKMKRTLFNILLWERSNKPIVRPNNTKRQSCDWIRWQTNWKWTLGSNKRTNQWLSTR